MCLSFYSAMLHEILKHGEMKLPCMPVKTVQGNFCIVCDKYLVS